MVACARICMIQHSGARGTPWQRLKMMSDTYMRCAFLCIFSSLWCCSSFRPMTDDMVACARICMIHRRHGCVCSVSIMTNQDRSEPIRTNKDKSGLIRTRQNRSEPIRTFFCCFGLLRLASVCLDLLGFFFGLRCV